MKLISNSFNSIEPKHVKDWRAKNEEEWEFEFTTERWSAGMRCDEAVCGEVLHLIGDTEVVDSEVELGNGNTAWGYEIAYRIQAIYPAPPMFRVSDAIPQKVKAELEMAFRMYWTDVSACVARLRTAVERLLDDQRVPKEKLQKKNGKPDKLRRMDLHERIESFTTGSAHKDQLQGLRNIGNLGTHGAGDVEDGDLFDALDVIEFVLSGIYDSKTINAKAAKLKGKKPKK